MKIKEKKKICKDTAEDTSDNYRLLHLCMDFGKLFVAVGAESYRVENSITRILIAYNKYEPSVFVIPTLLLVSFKDSSGKTFISSMRLIESKNDFTKLDLLNQLSRDLCQDEKKDLNFFDKNLKSIKRTKELKLSSNLFASILVAVGFIYLYGGSLSDAIGSVLVAFIMKITHNLLSKYSVNSLFVNISSSFISGVGAQLLHYFAFVDNPSIITVSAFMNLVPGLLMTNSIRDIMTGDYTSGTNKILEAIFISIALATGAALSVLLFR